MSLPRNATVERRATTQTSEEPDKVFTLLASHLTSDNIHNVHLFGTTTQGATAPFHIINSQREASAELRKPFFHLHLLKPTHKYTPPRLAAPQVSAIIAALPKPTDLNAVL